MNIELRVIVNGQHFAVAAGREIPELFNQCFEPLHSTDDRFLACVLGEATTDQAAIVMRTRKDAAEILAKEIADILVIEMSKHDTHNGYKNEQNVKSTNT